MYTFKNFYFYIKLNLFNLVLSIFSVSVAQYSPDSAELNAHYWNNLAYSSIQKALHQRPIEGKAKNVIIFLGDGMGISTITPARILKGQEHQRPGEEGQLIWDTLPFISHIKNYDVDKQVTDSAASATAFLCGVKTNFETLGVTARVPLNSRNCTLIMQNSVDSILKHAVDAGKSAGIVTTAPITDATPAAGYSHLSSRYWQAGLPFRMGKCKDIGRQLVENYPGSELKVIMGGGRANLIPTSVGGARKDNKNLIIDWLKMRNDAGLNLDQYKFVTDTSQLEKINCESVEYLLGLFANESMDYDILRNKEPNGQPSLAKMTEAAIKILSKNDNGFVLLVEGGLIDVAHHYNLAVSALYDTLAFDKAISKALKMLSIDETLFIVTADHSHTLTMQGYPSRGNSIFGIAGSDAQNVPYTTLMYENGPGYKRTRPDPSEINTTDPNYAYQTAFETKDGYATHGGEDVAVFSIGPWAHLFQATQEQPYIAHLMAFSACIGPYEDEKHCRDS